MHWQELSWTVHAAHQLLLEELLQAQGALAVSSCGAGDEAAFESREAGQPVWERVRVTGLFEATRELESVQQALREAFPEPLEPPHQRRFRDRDWLREWSRGLRPQCFGQRLWVVPRHLDAPAGADHVVFLDPGLAFGSGTHETTRMCLEWLVQQDLDGLEVLDVGCGSGLLGIAALKLGARHVVACDTDPLALEVTRDNADWNRVGDALEVHLPAHVVDRVADVLVANILLDALLEYATSFARQVRHGGAVVLSGVLHKQVDELLQVYGTAFEDLQVHQQAEWVRVVGRRRFD